MNTTFCPVPRERTSVLSVALLAAVSAAQAWTRIMVLSMQAFRHFWISRLRQQNLNPLSQSALVALVDFDFRRIFNVADFNDGV
ncbi:hypothetical protein [Herminiimonas sp. CN]|uniref:hypothetical protein n=1 Tax=Herminiimonas sp. CN TaxID=1349818 RepID=UPI0012DC8B1B|nr:hypothetical protein [Herminiimonas sp. CN]